MDKKTVNQEIRKIEVELFRDKAQMIADAYRGGENVDTCIENLLYQTELFLARIKAVI